jgi:hypothetical protein
MSILQIISPKYRKVRTFQDLINLNIQFIKGEIPGTPYHYGALSMDSQEQKDSLIRLNELGFFTMEGQGPMPEAKHQQKVYVSGFMNASLARPFIKFIKKYPKVQYLISFKSQDIKTNIRNWKENFENGFINGLTRKRLPDNEWDIITQTTFKNVYYDELHGFEKFGNIMYLFDQNEYIYIQIQLKSFCKKIESVYCDKDYLNKIIIEFLSQQTSFGKRCVRPKKPGPKRKRKILPVPEPESEPEPKIKVVPKKNKYLGEPMKRWIHRARARVVHNKFKEFLTDSQIEKVVQVTKDCPECSDEELLEKILKSFSSFGKSYKNDILYLTHLKN